MKNPVAFALPMFLGAGLALSVSACAEEAKTAQTADSTMTQPASMPADHAMPGHSAGSMELHRIMTDGQKKPMPMSGDVDKDFAAMMSIHHQMAIDMADVLLESGSNAELKAMAVKMKAAQQEEIKQMEQYTK
ncbi:DUF305 domain-containing protein [Thermomonas sp. XSG]|uniref:DUF305 domain-containing protein n=1 Tax=Thermomonas sp. XSG TaxID=2771436 RepID=UPI001CC20812|nr:DUF305 domain-containing protein [Thermomonas sp. XSG]